MAVLGRRKWRNKARDTVDRTGKPSYATLGRYQRRGWLLAVAPAGTTIHPFGDAWSMVVRLRLANVSKPPYPWPNLWGSGRIPRNVFFQKWYWRMVLARFGSFMPGDSDLTYIPGAQIPFDIEQLPYLTSAKKTARAYCTMETEACCSEDATVLSGDVGRRLQSLLTTHTESPTNDEYIPSTHECYACVLALQVRLPAGQAYPWGTQRALHGRHGRREERCDGEVPRKCLKRGRLRGVHHEVFGADQTHEP